ncbi:hypothetical protein FRB99_000084 [Tulasnella sp. 403]|nr:hypothetical protein FRB99_000084 [Tulasnella sp. 403]
MNSMRSSDGGQDRMTSGTTDRAVPSNSAAGHSGGEVARKIAALLETDEEDWDAILYLTEVSRSPAGAGEVSECLKQHIDNCLVESPLPYKRLGLIGKLLGILMDNARQSSNDEFLDHCMRSPLFDSQIRVMDLINAEVPGGLHAHLSNIPPEAVTQCAWLKEMWSSMQEDGSNEDPPVRNRHGSPTPGPSVGSGHPSNTSSSQSEAPATSIRPQQTDHTAARGNDDHGANNSNDTRTSSQTSSASQLGSNILLMATHKAECEIARVTALALTHALSSMKARHLEEGVTLGVLGECRAQCERYQELLLAKLDGASETSASGGRSDDHLTAETLREELLNDMLHVNDMLTVAIEKYDGLRRATREGKKPSALSVPLEGDAPRTARLPEILEQPEDGGPSRAAATPAAEFLHELCRSSRPTVDVPYPESKAGGDSPLISPLLLRSSSILQAVRPRGTGSGEGASRRPGPDISNGQEVPASISYLQMDSPPHSPNVPSPGLANYGMNHGMMWVQGRSRSSGQASAAGQLASYSNETIPPGAFEGGAIWTGDDVVRIGKAVEADDLALATTKPPGTMKKFFARKPPKQQPDVHPQSAPQSTLPQQQLTARDLPPVPTAPARPSLQQQQSAAYVSVSAPARKGSQDSASPQYPSSDSAWIVVDTASNNPAPPNPLYIRTQPSFESRSSSLASLPPGASPPVPYPPPSAAPPPPPPTFSPPITPTRSPTTRRLFPSRKLSDTHPRVPNGHSYAGTHPPPAIQNRSINGSGASVSAENLSLMSQSQESRSERKKGFFDWLAADKHPKERDRSIRPGSPDSATPQLIRQWDLTRMMGFVTATASEDWTLVMEVCEQASTESGAKEAAKALRSEFKYADPPAMLSAARLWAVLLRNTRAPFIRQSASKKFLEAVEETFNDPNTSPVVRDRLEIVIGGAAAQFGDDFPSFRSLWKKIKKSNAPAQGIPFDPKDAMFSPPARRLPRPNHQSSDGNRPISAFDILPSQQAPAATMKPQQASHPLPPIPGVQTHQGPVAPQSINMQASPGGQPGMWPAGEEKPRERGLDDRRGSEYDNRDLDRERTQRQPKHAQNPSRTSRLGIIPPEEDIRRLFEECEMAKGNAVLLSNALTFAKPEDVATSPLIREFHSKCMRSQDIVSAQIPWATAQADRARAQALASRPPDAEPTDSQTLEEELLAQLLQAHQELIEGFRVYDDLERLALAEREEKEVQERSRHETRLDRSQMYISADGSLMAQPPGGNAGSGSSRSPSPAPGLQYPHHSSPSPRAGHPLPVPPQGSAFIQAHPNGSSNTLAPPPPAPIGPRRPSSTRSRSPSPDTGSRRSIDAPRALPANGVLHPNVNGYTTSATPPQAHVTTATGTGVVTPSGGRLDSLRRGMSKLGLDVARSRSGSLTNGKGRRSAENGSQAGGAGGSAANLLGGPQTDDEETLKTPIQPSAKALGKRKADPPLEDEPFDQDDLFKDPRTGTPLGLPEESLLNSDTDSMDEGNNAKRVVYAYDAAAEREKERLEEAKSYVLHHPLPSLDATPPAVALNPSTTTAAP